MTLAVRPISADAPPALRAQLERLHTLEDVIRGGNLTLLDVVIQDEYTHDVIVAAGDLYLAFDST